MDTRKVTLIATIAVIALVAVGIGYAYTATTTNSGNNATSQYVTIIQANDTTGTGAYTFSEAGKVYWDSEDKLVNTAITTYYKLTGGDNTIITGNTVKKIGDSFVLKTQPQSGATGTAALTCTISSENFANNTVQNLTGDACFYLKVTPNATGGQAGSPVYFKLVNTAATGTPVWQFKSGSGTTWTGTSTFTINPTSDNKSYENATVEVYYGYEGNDGLVATHEQGAFPAAPTTTPLTSGKLTFSVSITPA